MRIVFCAIVLAALASLEATSARADTSLTPGKSAAFVTTSNVNIPTFFSPVGSVQILKGKKKRVVMVDVTAVETTNVATAIGLQAFVNSIAIEPVPFQIHETCTTTADGSCTTHAKYWADLDALELAHPGVFIGQPLDIEARAAKGGTGTVAATVSVHAYLVKK